MCTEVPIAVAVSLLVVPRCKVQRDRGAEPGSGLHLEARAALFACVSGLAPRICVTRMVRHAEVIKI